VLRRCHLVRTRGACVAATPFPLNSLSVRLACQSSFKPCALSQHARCAQLTASSAHPHQPQQQLVATAVRSLAPAMASNSSVPAAPTPGYSHGPASPAAAAAAAAQRGAASVAAPSTGGRQLRGAAGKSYSVVSEGFPAAHWPRCCGAATATLPPPTGARLSACPRPRRARGSARRS
jgi:hypothetical protein